MVLPNPKLTFLFKLTQSQKTKHVIDQMVDDYEDDPGTFFVFVSHNFTNAKNQTIGRIKDSGLDCVTLASDETEGTYSKVGDATMAISMDPKIKGLCMLAHPIRFKKRGAFNASDIHIILNHLEMNVRISRVMIYFDEFDGYSEILSKNANFICGFSKVERFELFSATWRDCPFVKKFDDIPLCQRVEIPESYDPTMYYTYEELRGKGKILCIENDYDWMVEVESTIKTTKACLGHSVYGFIPAMHKKKSHFDVATKINRMGYAVAIINSDFKGIQLPSGERHEFNSIDFKEPAHQILDLRTRLNITDLFVTGNACVGRSVTLQDDGLVFDIAVYHHSMTMTGDQLYQLDRTKGNLKRLGDKIPIIVCTKKAMKILESRERCAMLNTEGKDMTIHEYKREADRIAKEVMNGPKSHMSLVPYAITLSDDEAANLDAVWKTNRKKAVLLELISSKGYSIDGYSVKAMSKSTTEGSWKRKIRDGRKHAEGNMKWDFENDANHVVANANTVSIYAKLGAIEGAVDDWNGLIINRMELRM